MRTTVVPAQITTVEDRIAGNLTLPQIILLVIALVLGAGIYGMMAPKLDLGNIKLTLIIIQSAFFCVLAWRINGKILADWLIIYLRYWARPRRYIFSKNDLIHRDIFTEKEELKIAPKEEETNPISEKSRSLTLPEQIRIDQIFDNDALSVSFKMSKKGGVDVCLKQVES